MQPFSSVASTKANQMVATGQSCVGSKTTSWCHAVGPALNGGLKMAWSKCRRTRSTSRSSSASSRIIANTLVRFSCGRSNEGQMISGTDP